MLSPASQPTRNGLEGQNQAFRISGPNPRAILVWEIRQSERLASQTGRFERIGGDRF